MATPGRTRTPRRRDARGRFARDLDTEPASPGEPTTSPETIYDRSAFELPSRSSGRFLGLRLVVRIASAAAALVVLVLTGVLLTSQPRLPTPAEPSQVLPGTLNATQSASESATPSARVRAANGRFSFRGASAVTVGPMRIGAGDYTVRWTATAVAEPCIFRVQLSQEDGRTVALVPEVLAPYRATLSSSAVVTLETGTYSLEVGGSGCEWRLRLNDEVPSRPPAP
jgi:hypothetical protein